MGYDYKVSTDDVEQKASVVRSEASNLETQIGTLTRNMGELASTWTGTASGRFQELYHQWQKQAGLIQTALSDIHGSLTTINSNYINAETANIKNATPA